MILMSIIVGCCNLLVPRHVNALITEIKREQVYMIYQIIFIKLNEFVLQTTCKYQQIFLRTKLDIYVYIPTDKRSQHALYYEGQQ